jgi:sulfate permease, SulP family
MKSVKRPFMVQVYSNLGQSLSRPGWLNLVTPTTLRQDIFAGLTGATIVLPQAVAFAAIAGLPPQYGFYTALVTPVVAAWFGSSLHAVSGPTTAISALVFGALSGLYPIGSPAFLQGAVALALLAGLIQFALGLARMGALVSFVSHSVMTGFVTGAALLIAFSQVQHILRLDLPRPENLLIFFVELGHSFTQSDPLSIGLAGVAIVVATLLRKFVPRAPNYLLALLASTGVYIMLGPTAGDVLTVGAVSSVIPSFNFPEAPVAAFRELASPALAIALVGLLEASAIGRALAARSGQEFDANREFTGQGLSNISGAFFGCYPGSASFTRSGVNYDAGAATPLSAILSALFLFLLLIYVAPYFAWVPVSAMAGVIILVAWRLINLHEIIHIAKLSVDEAAVAAVTLICALFVDLEFSIYAGVILATILFMRRSSQPLVSIGLPNADEPHRPFEPMNDDISAHCPQFIVAGIDGPLFFGSVDAIRREFRRIEQQFSNQSYMILLIKGVGSIDMPAAELLIEEAQRRSKRGGGLMIQTKIPRAREQLRQFSVERYIVDNRIYRHKGEAISALFTRLNSDVCASCALRIYRECHSAGSNRTDLPR